MAIPIEIIADHYKRFFPSLHQFPEHYTALFFSEPSAPPRHMAYLCPLCVSNGFVTIDDVAVAWRGEFTKDHYPPENVGGKAHLLVCQSCNNQAGHLFESELVKQMSVRSYNKKMPGSTLAVKAKISNIPGNYNSEISVGENQRLEVSFKPKEKAKIVPLDNWLEASRTDNNWSADITVTDPDELKVSRALLKAAYLCCFNIWAYEFVYSYAGEEIRKVITGEVNYPLKNPSFWLTDNLAKGQLEPGVYKITQPADWQKFIVIMQLTDLTTGYEDIIGVIIPGPTAADYNSLDAIQAVLDEEQALTLTFESVVQADNS